ncbi:MAG: T9SS type A sorting domain-containing protein, partial [Muribaculaceae bacterium]|nr:T9SS type A sorting domain-containing protein [Muribaculaceae bacterium]
VYLKGYDEFKTVTDAEGSYLIEGIYADTGIPYDVVIKSPFFNTYHNKALIIDSDMTYDIELGETPLRVHNLKAAAGEGNVELTWEAPVSEFKYDNGVPDTYLGWNHGHSHTGIFSVYNEHILVKEIRFYVTDSQGPHANFNVLIFALDENGYPDPDNILYSAQKIPYVDNAWTSHILKTPVEVNGCAVCVNCDIFLGLGASKADDDHPFAAGMHFFAGDEYMAPDGIIDFTHFDDLHPMLRIGGDYLGEGVSEHNPSRITRPSVKYELYRHTADNVGVGTFIGSTTDLNFTDMPTTDVAAGKYRYSAVATYTTEESEPVMSNEVDYTPSSIITIAGNNKIQVSYNSANAVLTLSDITQVTSLRIVDMSGKTVFIIEKPSEIINLSDLSAGAYIITLSFTDGNQENHKIVTF